jgi:hypothetical protein
MGTYTFPTDMFNTDDYGHMIVFSAYSPQSARAAALIEAGTTPIIPGINNGRPLVTSQRSLLDQFYLYVPGGGQGSNLTWAQEHEYDEVKMSRLGTGAASGAMSAILGIGASTIGKAAADAAGLFRVTINPYVEVLYRGTKLRQYMFSFMFAPQSEADSKELYGTGPGTGLLNRFRFHAAPDAGPSGDALLFSSPSEWEVDFLYKVPGPNGGTWAENNKLPKIAKGIINRVDVDYSPDSEFSTFEQGDATSSRLSLTFTEMEIIDKTRIGQGF